MSTTEENLNPMIAEVFKEENFYTFNGKLSGLAVVLATEWKYRATKYSAFLKTLTPMEAAQIFFAVGAEVTSRTILQFLRGEIARENTHNPIEKLTIASPSENKFVNVGVVALDSLLVMHMAAHYILGQAMGEKPSTEMSDDELSVYFRDCCNQVPRTIELLKTHIPELSGEKIDENIH